MRKVGVCLGPVLLLPLFTELPTPIILGNPVSDKRASRKLISATADSRKLKHLTPRCFFATLVTFLWYDVGADGGSRTEGRHSPLPRVTTLSLPAVREQRGWPCVSGGACVRFKFPALDSLAAGRGPHELPHQSPVACLFFLPSYRASFLLPLPSSMAMVIFFLVAVLMVVALVGLLLWFFFLREG